MLSSGNFNWRVASVSVLVAGASFGAQALSLTTTLPTTNLDANAVFSFSQSAQDAMGLFNIGVSGLGNAKAQAGQAWAFDMPVTQVSLATSLLPFSITPVSGQASGSALGISGSKGGLVLANFSLDFKRNVLMADLTTSLGTSKGFDVYSFNVADGLHVSTSGGLSMQMTLDQMMLTTGAQAKFGQALGLPSFAVSTLSYIDFGTLSIDISPALRFGISDKAFTASMVPEGSPVWMMGLGLVGIAAVSRRKLAN